MGQSFKDVNRITQEVVDITQNVLNQAQTVIGKLQKTKKRCVEAPKHALQEVLEKTNRLLEQAKQVVGGNRINKDCLISIHDSEARPITKGKLAKPTEFGYKVRIDETESGFVTGCDVHMANPSDEELLLPAIKQHVQTWLCALCGGNRPGF